MYSVHITRDLDPLVMHRFPYSILEVTSSKQCQLWRVNHHDSVTGDLVETVKNAKSDCRQAVEMTIAIDLLVCQSCICHALVRNSAHAIQEYSVCLLLLYVLNSY